MLALCLNVLSATREVLWFPLLRQKYTLTELQIGICSGAVAMIVASSSVVAQKLAKCKTNWINLTLTAQIIVIMAGLIVSIFSSLGGLVVGAMLIGISGVFHGLPSALIRKNEVPAHLQGAALAVARILSRLIVPISMFVLSWLQTKISSQNIFGAIAILVLIFSAVPFLKLFYSKNHYA